MREPLGVIGAGWVGLVTAACFADLGHDVVLRDVLPERIAELEAGRMPIYEPGLAELVERNRERLRFTLDPEEVLAAARIAFVCVPTPPTYTGEADLSAVWSVVDELPELSERTILVMKSTVPVGTGEKVRFRLDGRGLAHVGYVSNPEFLAEGTALRDFMHPDRVVIGAFEEADGDAVEALYAPIEVPIVRAEVGSAEMVKLASNAFLARTSARRPGRTSASWPREWDSTAGSAPSSCAPASATRGRACPRTSPPSSSSPATLATTFSSSQPSSR
jgi:UDPglucose 6-dehydrogenase